MDEIESDVLNILFHKGNTGKNKAYAIENLKPLLKELNGYCGVTTEYLFNLMRWDERSKTTTTAKMKARLRVVLNRLGIEKHETERFYYEDVTLKKRVEVEQYHKPILKSVVQVYPCITEVNFIYTDEFVNDGLKSVQVVETRKRPARETYHELKI